MLYLGARWQDNLLVFRCPASRFFYGDAHLWRINLNIIQIQVTRIFSLFYGNWLLVFFCFHNFFFKLVTFTSITCFLDFGMWIGQNFTQFRDDVGQAGRELFRSAVSHRSQQLCRPCLCAPQVLVERIQQGRQDQAHAVCTQVPHDCARCVVSCLCGASN